MFEAFGSFSHMLERNRYCLITLLLQISFSDERKSQQVALKAGDKNEISIEFARSSSFYDRPS